MREIPGVEIVTRDLLAEADAAMADADRIGPPIDVESHEIHKPGSVETQTAKSHTLTDMAKDYEFFTPAVIYRMTPLGRDPLYDFNAINPPKTADDEILIIDTSYQFFEGLGVCLQQGVAVNFDHRLYAVRRDRWIALREFLSGIVVSNPTTQYFGRVQFYEMPLVDQFALKKMSVVTKLPAITITVFGVSSTVSFAYIQERSFPAHPTLVQQPPKADIRVEQQRMLNRVTGSPL